jgi:hypothetical protein
MMMPKPSLFAEEERGNRRSKLGDPLVGLSKHVDFAALADEIDTALPRPSCAKGGRPPYPTVLMTKILVLQQLYNLADDALEYQLLDRFPIRKSSVTGESPRHVPASNTSLARCATWGGQTGALHGNRTRHLRVAPQNCQLQLAAARVFERTRPKGVLKCETRRDFGAFAAQEARYKTRRLRTRTEIIRGIEPQSR